MYNPEKSSRSHYQDSHRDSSPKRLKQDIATRRASEKHVINWSDRHLSTLHDEPIDPMIHEAKLADRYDKQTDQRTSTSGSGLEHGGLGQAKDKQQFTNLMNQAPEEIKDAIFQKFDILDIVRIYRSFDDGHKILDKLDDNERKKVMENLKISDIAECFDILKTSGERKEFLRSISPDKFIGLYQHFENDAKKRGKFLSGLDLKQIADLNKHILYDYQKREICRAIPLSDLKILMDKFGVKYKNFTTRQYAEYFNTRETYNERKAFVRELELEQVVKLYNFFEDDPNKQKEICRAIAKEDLKTLKEKHNYWAGKELDNRWKAELFSGLKTSSERKKFLERFNAEDIADLYLYFDNDINKQKELCRSITLKVFKSFVEHLNFYESEVARSCLKEWEGRK